MEDESLVVEDTAIANEEDEPEYVFAGMNDNVQFTRRYDIYLTYDKYYQTPRVFLSGSDENGQPYTLNKFWKILCKIMQTKQ